MHVIVLSTLACFYLFFSSSRTETDTLGGDGGGGNAGPQKDYLKYLR